MTVGELLARTTSRELSEWWAYFSVNADELVLADLQRMALQRLGQRSRKKGR